MSERENTVPCSSCEAYHSHEPWCPLYSTFAKDHDELDAIAQGHPVADATGDSTPDDENN
jgi:hypothetical protein